MRALALECTYPDSMGNPLTSFEAVLFDLDGTLVATDRFWPDAARAGALRAFGELGLDRALPTAEEWMSLVGLPLAEGFDRLFADLEPAPRKRVLDRCVEEEHRLLADGRAGLLPGVLEALQGLKQAGLRIGIASNCSQAYLDSMMQGLSLQDWVDEARCLESPGIGDKAEMLRELLIEFDTRRALMVGDRDGDRWAAWQNGLPHVHLTRGYASRAERVPAEAVMAGMDGLLPRMRGRGMWAANILSDLGWDLGSTPQGAIAIAGPPAAGKAWLANDLQRILTERGVSVQMLDASAFYGWDSALASTSELDPDCMDREALMLAIGGLGVDCTLVHGPGLAQAGDLWQGRIELDVAQDVMDRRIAGGHPLGIGVARPERVPLARRMREWELAALEASPKPRVLTGRNADNWLPPGT